jgi:hypothetical protein
MRRRAGVGHMAVDMAPVHASNEENRRNVSSD